MSYGKNSNPAVLPHDFSKVPKADTQRSAFRRTAKHITAFDSGMLIPFYVDEVIPGHTVTMDVSAVIRLTTCVAPFMDTLMMSMFFFFVPNRILWDNWDRLMGERRPDPDSSIDYLTPQVHSGVTTTLGQQSMGDYFGLPPDVQNFYCNAFHFRAYNRIWNDWFRDQSLQDSVVVHTGNGPDPSSDYQLKRRGKRHDYFTSCLPWPLKSAEGDVSIPLGTSAPVRGIGKVSTTYPGAAGAVYEAGGNMATYTSYGYPDSPSTWRIREDPARTGYPGIYADLNNAAAATINSLREAFMLQAMMERDARGGSRYCELIRSHFGVTDPQHNVLQRPEFLGGGSRPVIVEPIPATSSYSTEYVGDLKATAYCNATGLGFRKSFTEHGVLLGLVCIDAPLTYQQGVHRMWDRRSRVDFYWPSLCGLGEQEVKSREIYCTGAAEDDNVFGYQERWSEMKYMKSLVTGRMNSNATFSLDHWHLAEDFYDRPVLNGSFIESSPPVDRVITVVSEPHWKADFYLDSTSVLPMPVYNIPGWSMGRL